MVVDRSDGDVRVVVEIQLGREHGELCVPPRGHTEGGEQFRVPRNCVPLMIVRGLLNLLPQSNMQPSDEKQDLLGIRGGVW